MKHRKSPTKWERGQLCVDIRSDDKTVMVFEHADGQWYHAIAGGEVMPEGESDSIMGMLDRLVRPGLPELRKLAEDLAKQEIEVRRFRERVESEIAARGRPAK